jgi:hypothetical protein
MGKEHLDHGVMGLAIGGAQGCVQRRLAGFGSRPVHIRTLLDQKSTKTRMSVEGSHVEIIVLPQGLKGLSVREEELHGADIAVVGAPLKERYAVLVRRRHRVARGDVFEHQVCVPVCNALEYVFAHMRFLRGVSPA